MIIKLFRVIIPLFFTICLIFCLNSAWGPIPALGKFFSPFTGFLVDSGSSLHSNNEEVSLKGLKGKVKIFYDENSVPHIFAENDEDLYFAQGYVVAKDRLWQMEFYTLSASGRLTEVVGDAALNLDRYNRRIGMPQTAEGIIEYVKENDPVSWMALEAYTAGVNAYIHTLKEKNYPVEYKILNYAPEEWTPYKSILMLMNMRLTLSGGTNDLRMTNVFNKYGLDVVNELFPKYPHEESPIIPAGTTWGFSGTKNQILPPLFTERQHIDSILVPEAAPQVGSNNWAVSGEKTASGLPILANDPHLGLSLPSIWYQIQLSTPHSNAYGVALPGTPAIIIGFNKDVAWGVTNVGSDVMDFYNIQFRDESRDEYLWNNEWRKTRKTVERYRIKGGVDFLDTLIYTHHGPVVYDKGKDIYRGNAAQGHAMKWAGNITDGSDLKTFYLLNRAENYRDYRDALSTYTGPPQNFVFASNENDIAITSNGRLPAKWEEQGRFLLDGSKSEYDWQDWIPFEENPTVKNPERNFVSSANQFPVDKNYPYYLDWSFAHPSRALRINKRLELMTNANIDSFRNLLNDNFNLDAFRTLPVLLKYLEGSTFETSEAFAELSRWDFNNEASSIAASIFDKWFKNLHAGIWSDDFPEKEGMRSPTLDQTIHFLKEVDMSKWYDDVRTSDIIETKQDVVLNAFEKALTDLEEVHGTFSANNWNWAKVKNTTIAHLVPNFVSFSRSHIVIGGHENSVNATSGTHGPSWKMVVQLDKNWPIAYGVYPGGQSGSPSSPFYDNMIEPWSKGELLPLFFMKNAEDKSSLIINKIILNPEN